MLTSVNISRVTSSSDAAVTNATTANVTELVGANSSQVNFCSDTSANDDPVLMFSTALLTLSCVIPYARKHSALLSRLLLSRLLLVAAWLVTALWSGLQLCSSDTLVWSATFVTINAIFAVRLVCLWYSIHTGGRQLGEVHRRLLRPLGVSSQQLQLLGQAVVKQRLGSGQHFAVENTTVIGHQLSVLLSGRLEVSYGDSHLHFISPCEFINSLEWDLQCPKLEDSVSLSTATNMSCFKYYQVSIMAVEDCVYVTFDSVKLESLMNNEPRLFTILKVAVGRDITQKVYNVAEHHPISRQQLSLPAKLDRSTAAAAVSNRTRQQPPAGRYSSQTGRSCRRDQLLQLPLKLATPSADTDNYHSLNQSQQ